MRVYLGSDHAGLERKNAIIQHLRAAGHETVDCGAHVYDALDDYPAYCIETARRVVADEGSSASSSAAAATVSRSPRTR
jgi:ribose 5-phosphate isomerase B